MIINGRSTYTIDSLETLYDHAIGKRAYPMEKSRAYGHPKQTVAAERMFNDDPAFVSFLKALALEALEGQGDISRIETYRYP